MCDTFPYCLSFMSPDQRSDHFVNKAIAVKSGKFQANWGDINKHSLQYMCKIHKSTKTYTTLCKYLPHATTICTSKESYENIREPEVVSRHVVADSSACEIFY
jgi:hypothetical protein